jgi:hypothetical protein
MERGGAHQNANNFKSRCWAVVIHNQMFGKAHLHLLFLLAYWWRQLHVGAHFCGSGQCFFHWEFLAAVSADSETLAAHVSKIKEAIFKLHTHPPRRCPHRGRL